MSPRRVTSRHVAELAGVSQTTVSFVLNDVEGMSISDETRQRVFDAVRELNYVPDVTARALVRGRTNNLVLLLVNPHPQIFSDPFIPNVMTGLSNAAKRKGFRILVERVDDSDPNSTLSALYNLLHGREVAGAVVSGWVDGLHEAIYPLVLDGYPLVCTDPNDVAGKSVPYTAIDHLAGVQTIMEHLLALGHRRIGFITYAPFSDVQLSTRFQKCQEMLKAAGVAFDECLLRIGAFNPESGYHAAQSLLDEVNPPTAIFGMNDLMALGAMTAVHERGQRIPQDMTVVGYDDMRFAPYLFPPLTTVHAPEIEMGESLGEMLIGLVKSKHNKTTQRFLTPKLVIRGSCGKPR